MRAWSCRARTCKSSGTHSIVVLRRFIPSLGSAYYLPFAGRRAVLRPSRQEKLGLSEDQWVKLRQLCCRFQGLELLKQTSTAATTHLCIIRGVPLESATVAYSERCGFYQTIHETLVEKAGVTLVDYAWLEHQARQWESQSDVLIARAPLAITDYIQPLTYWFEARESLPPASRQNRLL